MFILLVGHMLGASPVLGTEGFERNGDLVPLEKPLPSRKDEV